MHVVLILFQLPLLQKQGRENMMFFQFFIDSFVKLKMQIVQHNVPNIIVNCNTFDKCTYTWKRI
jgi:hypothetical protein